jgi:ketosteroid isomerase-like protein
MKNIFIHRRAVRFGLALIAFASGLVLTIFSFPGNATEQHPEALIRELNQQYVQSFLNADAAMYDKILADDFVCLAPNGVFLNKREFLEEVKKGAMTPPKESLEYFRTEDVSIRFATPDIAVIHATTPFKRKDGAGKVNQYTDIWRKRDGRWQTISANVTPVADTTSRYRLSGIPTVQK